MSSGTEKCPDCHNGMFMDAAGPGQCVRCNGTGFIAKTSNQMTGEHLGELRQIALQALNNPVDPSTPLHERDLCITAQDLIWLLDHLESPLKRAVRIARGHQGPPDEPIRFADETTGG